MAELLRETRQLPTNYHKIRFEKKDLKTLLPEQLTLISNFLKDLVFIIMDLWTELVQKVNPVIEDSHDEHSAFQTFTDADTTPDISGGRNFKTANSGATTITMLDGGTDGQTIRVVFGDSNTTIDFTGTNLKGNAGADWSPTQNDHMICTFDGTDWFCDISDNTA